MELFVGLLLLIFVVSGVYLARKKPRHDRNWKPDFAREPFVTFEGDFVSVHNVRNNRYPQPDEPYETVFETRHYDLSLVKRVWFIVESFSSWDAIAHTFVSFEFSDGQFLAVSNEARTKENEKYSIVRGVLREFELLYTFGDEQDFIGRRAIYQNHEVYLYPLRASKQEARIALESILRTANDIHKNPRFYNSITANCTSTLVQHANIARPGSFPPFVWAQVLPGISDKKLFDKGWIATTASRNELRKKHAIKDKVIACQESPDFSRCIRQ